MIYHKTFSADDMKEESKVQTWIDTLEEKLNKDRTSGSHRYEFKLRKDNELNIFMPYLTMFHHGVESEYLLSKEFFVSEDYKKISTLGEQLESLIEPGAFVKRGEKIEEVETFSEVLEWLMSEARKGQSIQRYKGLGEMNPEQLWETTMDPETRRMLQVTIEDAVAADQLFTTLMGDHVEPRREFIESNALSVSNLDI
jgi:DNA gyrase subunit B